MLDSIEKLRRERRDVCSGCGWNMLQIDSPRYECINNRCLNPEHLRRKRHRQLST